MRELPEVLAKLLSEPRLFDDASALERFLDALSIELDASFRCSSAGAGRHQMA